MVWAVLAPVLGGQAVRDIDRFGLMLSLCITSGESSHGSVPGDSGGGEPATTGGHCALCAASATAPPPPIGRGEPLPIPGLREGLPALHAQASRTLAVWSTAHARAPPVAIA